MSTRSLSLDDRLYDYLLAHCPPEHPELQGLRAATAELSAWKMQIAPEQGHFMRLLIELTGAKRALEVGTFTGYSALATALSLPDDGQIICCDVSEEFTSVGQPFWERAGVAHKIDLRLAPALETLDALLAEGNAGAFDFMFIDADKENYGAYYERGLDLLRAGGLIAVDNVLWGGSVANPDKQDEETQAIRALNDRLAADARVSLSMVPIGDGLTLARKR